MKVVVVTGASGFLGKNLYPYLKKNGFTPFPLSLKNKNWKELFPKNAYAIIHLAGLNENKKISEYDYFKINTELTKEVLQYFNQSNLSKFIYFSSVKALTNSLNHQILEEGFEAKPDSAYGKSKLAAEQYILSHQKSEKSYYIFRPCMIHGPGNKGNLNILFQMVNKGIPYPFAAFHNKRSFLSIENLNFIVQEFLDQEIKTGIYHLADSETLSTIDVLKIIQTCSEKKINMWAIHPKLMFFFAKFGSFFHLPFGMSEFKKLTENYEVSNLKLIKAIGKELPYSAEKGIQNTILAFKN